MGEMKRTNKRPATPDGKKPGTTGDTGSLELKLSFFPGTHNYLYYEVVGPWVDRLESDSAGRIKVARFFGEELAKADDQLDITEKGVTDFGFINILQVPGRFPLTEVMSLPFLFADVATSVRVLQRLWNEYLAQEWEIVHVLAMFNSGPSHIWSRKPVLKLADFKGLRTNALGPSHREALLALGAVPVNMTVYERYGALQDGKVDAVCSSISAGPPWKLQEVAPHVTLVGMNSSPAVLMMNKKSYHALPRDLQSLLGQVTDSMAEGQGLSMLAAWAYDRADRATINDATKLGITLHRLSHAEMTELREVTKSVSERWAKDRDARGLPGSSLLSALRSLIA